MDKSAPQRVHSPLPVVEAVQINVILTSESGFALSTKPSNMAKIVRDALIDKLPPGTGVGDATYTIYPVNAYRKDLL